MRRNNVPVGNVYRGAPAEGCDYLLAKMCDHLNGTGGKDDAHATAILTALFAHIYLALIHPFGDGNRRAARLLEFFILLRAGLPSPAGRLLSNHYNLTRSKYYSELDKISKSGGDPHSFLEYALDGFVDGLKEQIALIREEQLSVSWENYVYEQFRGKKPAADTRRRELVLALSKQHQPVKVGDIMELGPRMAREYHQ